MESSTETLKIRDMVLQKGQPKICVPLTAANEADLLEEARLAKLSGADLAEWRVDCFKKQVLPQEAAGVLNRLRAVLQEMPLIFTFRTKKQGGEQELERAAYTELLCAAVCSGFIDIVDVELCSGKLCITKVLQMAKQQGVAMIISEHNFEKTPPQEELLNILAAMQALGGDILKIAVMPHSTQDVLTLLQATNAAATKGITRPLITISMGRIGRVSRVVGGFFGSRITFGVVKNASAPGQLRVDELKKLLPAMHKEIQN